MKKQKRSLQLLNSIRFKLIAGVLALLIPLNIFLLYNNLYAIRVIHNQVAESNLNLLNLYMKQIDTSLGAVNSFLNGLISFDGDLHDIAISQDNTIRVLTKVSISNKMQTNILTYPNLDEFFFYVSSENDYFYAFSQYSAIDERAHVNAYIQKLLSDYDASIRASLSGWFSAEIEGQYYLLRILPTYDNFIGAWVNVKRLLLPMKFIDLGENGASMLINRNREIMAISNTIDMSQINLNHDFDQYYLSGENNRYLVVGTQSGMGDLLLAAIVPDDKSLENLPYLKQIIYFIIIGAFLLIPISLYFIRRTILKPMNNLMGVMRDIRNGDIEVRLKEKHSSTEFVVLNQTFNNMLDEIHDLRISVYEEQINKQNAELEHLQNQVSPHFFLNSLNMIYRLAQSKKYELIQEMSMSLIQYFRYIFRQRRVVVPLRDELDHVRNYLRIQELRFPEQLFKEILVPEYLLDTPVPPLIVQTLVENVIKYAVTGDSPTYIQITVDLITADDISCLRIRLRDNGIGFPLDVLEDLREGKKIVREDGLHIGIWNLKKRLDLLYLHQAHITFDNIDSSGAEINITLPLKPLNENVA